MKYRQPVISLTFLKYIIETERCSNNITLVLWEKCDTIIIDYECTTNSKHNGDNNNKLFSMT